MSEQEQSVEVAKECVVNEIRLVAVNADALNYETPYEGVHVQFELGQFQGKLIEGGVRVRAKAETKLFADGEKERVLGEVGIWYEIDLSVPEEQAESFIHDPDRKGEIIDEYVAPALFPYVRQKIHDLTNELPLVPVLLPVNTLRGLG